LDRRSYSRPPSITASVISPIPALKHWLCRRTASFVMPTVNGGTPGFTVHAFNTDGGPDANFWHRRLCRRPSLPRQRGQAVPWPSRPTARSLSTAPRRWQATATLASRASTRTARWRHAFGFNQNGLVVYRLHAPAPFAAHLNTLARRWTIAVGRGSSFGG